MSKPPNHKSIELVVNLLNLRILFAKEAALNGLLYGTNNSNPNVSAKTLYSIGKSVSSYALVDALYEASTLAIPFALFCA